MCYEPFCSTAGCTGSVQVTQRDIVQVLSSGGLSEYVLHKVLRGWQHAELLPSLFHHWHIKPFYCREPLVTKKPTLSRRPFHKALKCSAWWGGKKKPLYKVTCDKKTTSHFQSSQRTWKCRSLQRENSRFHWLTNTFGCQTRLQADRQVCFQVEGRVGIWVSQCFNSTAVAAGCLRTTCSTNIKGRSAITLLLILFMFHAALKYIFSPKPLNHFFFLQHLL